MISALQAKKKNGEFIGAIAPYGYQKSLEFKNKLIPNPEEAEIVHCIFERRLQGNGFTAIARWLNDKKFRRRRQNWEIKQRAGAIRL